jgi:hypothetical protein
VVRVFALAARMLPWPARARPFALAAVTAGVLVAAGAAAAVHAQSTAAQPTQIVCNSLSAQSVGSFAVSCSGAAAQVVSVTASASQCPTGAASGAGGTCQVTFQIAVDKQGLPSSYAIVSGGVSQSFGSATAGATADFTYVLDAAGAAPLPLEVSVAAAAGTSLSGVTCAIQDNQNVADGAAKSQAVE